MYSFFAAFWSMGSALMPIGNLAAVLAAKMSSRRDADATVWAAIILILLPIRIAVNVYP